MHDDGDKEGIFFCRGGAGAHAQFLTSILQRHQFVVMEARLAL